MKASICLTILCLALLFGMRLETLAQNKTFFQTVAGKWQGTLEYSDYKTEQRTTLKTILEIKSSADGNSAELFYVYDDFGKVIKDNETNRIDLATNKFVFGKDEFTIETITDGKLVLLGKQVDNEKLEPIRETITFSNDSLTILKEVQAPFQFRHQYTLRRVIETAPEKMLTPVQLAGDWAILKKALIQLHPGIYRYNTPAQVENSFNEFADKLNIPLPEGEFFKLVSQLVSQIKCGHTFLNPLNQSKEVQQRLSSGRNYLPFYFRLINRKMIVTGNLSSKKLARGSEITKINGAPIAQIIDSLISITTADGENTAAHRLKDIELEIAQENRNQLFDIYFPLFFPLKDSVFEIEALDYQSKKPVKFQVLAMTRVERYAETEKLYGKTPTYDDGWKFEVQKDNLAYLKISNSITWRLKNIEFKKFIADAFAAIRQQNVKNLIIDLRDNGGGDTDVGFELAKHLAKEKLPRYIESKRLVRNVAPQPDLAKYLDTYDERLKAVLQNGMMPNLYQKAENGFFEILPSENLESYPEITPTENSFKGETYIIADASNASATFQFLNYVQENRLATIIGQETGGNKQGINGGNYFFLRLPNSRIEIDFPVYYFAPLTAQKDEGIIPDKLIQPHIDDVAIGVDTELNYVIAVIRRDDEKK